MAQSWKQITEDLAGPEPPLTLAYVFSSTDDEGDSAIYQGGSKLPQGLFYEREKHGAWDGTE